MEIIEKCIIFLGIPNDYVDLIKLEGGTACLNKLRSTLLSQFVGTVVQDKNLLCLA